MMKVEIVSGKRIVLLFAAIISGLLWSGQVFAQADITAFNFDLTVTYAETIDNENAVINVEVYNSVDLTKLVAIFTTSPGATVKIGSVTQVSGSTVNDYTNQVVYTVTSADASLTKSWKVNVTKRAASNEKQLFSFQFPAIPGAVGTVDEGNHTVQVTVPFSQDLTALVASFSLSPLAYAKVGTTIQISGVSANDYTNTLTFKVIAENGSSRNYYITVSKAPVETGKKLLSFAFNELNPVVTGVIDESNHSVSVTVPYEVDETDLVATFTSSYRSVVKVNNVIQTSGVTANDFTAPVEYLVIAENGASQAYTVTVSKAPASTAAEILSYKLLYQEEEVVAVITGTNITATIPFAWDITNLIAVFELSEFASAKVNGNLQISNETVNNFSSTISYVITAQDPTVTKSFTVQVTQTEASQANDLLSFDFLASINTEIEVDVIGDVNKAATTVTLEVRYGTDLAALIPSFSQSEFATVSVNGTIQVSGVSAQNFTNPVSYAIEAEDGSVEIYTVTVKYLPASQENTLLTYLFALNSVDYTGVIDEVDKTVVVHVPYGTDRTNLVATFTISPYATAKVGNLLQESAVTANNFTNPVVYSIISQDESVEFYTITVIVDPNTENKFISFSFQDLSPVIGGTIDHVSHTIELKVPQSTNRTALVASFVVSDNSEVYIGTVQQVSGVTANNFTNPINYTVIAENGAIQDYLVTVINLPLQTGKSITAFSFPDFDPDVVGSIDENTGNITAIVPFGTDVTALVATFSNSLLSTVHVGSVLQVSGTTPNDFTNPVSYVVTAEDGSTQTYVVTVVVLPASSAKQLIYFAFLGLDPDVVGTINQTTRTVSLVVPQGTDRTSLVATFTISEFATLRIQNVQAAQVSGVSANNFTNPVTYEVYAQNGTYVQYVVTVTEEQDLTPPVVTVVTTDGNQTNMNLVSNALGQYVVLRSNEATGKVYIVQESVAQTTVYDLEAAVAAGKGNSTLVSVANQNIPLSTYRLPEGKYYAYATDENFNKSEKSSIAITISDKLPPSIIIQTQTISNGVNNTIYAQSTDKEGTIYLIKEGVSQATKAQLDAAVTAKNGSKGYVFAAFTNITIPVAGLSVGAYHAYAVDVNNNISDASSQIVTITAASRAKSISSFSFQETNPASIGQITGTLIEVTVPKGTSLLNLRASFTISLKSKAYVGLVEQISGFTVNDFSEPVVYRVEAEDGSALDYTIQVTVDSGTGIEEVSWEESILVYPNPVQDELNLSMLHPVDRVVVTDLLGQVILDLEKPSRDQVKIDTQSWKPGLFVIRFLKNEATVYTSKLIKK